MEVLAKSGVQGVLENVRELAGDFGEAREAVAGRRAAQRVGGDIKTLEIFTARLGPEAPEVSDAYNDIGGTYHRAGDYQKALDNSLHVLAIREKVLGPEHADVGESLVNTAIEAKNLEKWNIVDANYPRALAIFEKALGPEHPDTANSLTNLACLCRAHHVMIHRDGYHIAAAAGGARIPADCKGRVPTSQPTARGRISVVPAAAVR